jgi:hypothetical protein
VWVVIGEAALVLTVAALSYKFVEQPIRTGSLQRRLANHPRRYRLEVIGASALGLAVAFSILFVTPASLNPVSAYVTPPKAKGATHHKQTTTTIVVSQQTGHKHKSKTKPTLPPGRILALGDSVMLGCSRELKIALHHHVHVDATVGRQIDDTIKELKRLRRHDHVPKIVVIQVGNNGPLWYPDLVRLRQALRGVPDVVVVNVRNTTSWQDESNHALGNWVHDWRAAHLADWYGSSTPKMLQDGTHPGPYGCTIYARVIADTLRST